MHTRLGSRRVTLAAIALVPAGGGRGFLDHDVRPYVAGKDKADVLKRAEEIALREVRMLPLIRKHKSVGEAIKAYNWI